MALSVVRFMPLAVIFVDENGVFKSFAGVPRQAIIAENRMPLLHGAIPRDLAEQRAEKPSPPTREAP
jgi:hypothetical protein